MRRERVNIDDYYSEPVMLSKIQYGAFLSLCLAHVAFAGDVDLTGTIPVKLPKISSNSKVMVNTPPDQMIKLLNVSLSSKARSGLSQRFILAEREGEQDDAGLPKRVQLEMNHVPPLNQGNHGTCVTFAATAAVDAILGKGDYISQLCQLELGTYLEHNSYTSSGWDGSWGRIILNQMDVFGFTSKAYQQANGCAGIQEYPSMGETPSAELSVLDFHLISESFAANQVAWSSILEVYQLSSEDISPRHVLHEVKRALNAGDRLTFGVLLPNINQGLVGALGSYRQPYDTWTLTPEITKDIEGQTEFAGHEMVITGYDDDAVVYDNQGRSYTGLLKLRNSWGSRVGDEGNFYMTYDFFKRLTLEVQRVRHLS